MNWKLAAAIPILLVIILGTLFLLGQPKTNDDGDIRYKDVNGDEYLPGDYVMPGSTAETQVYLPPGLSGGPTYPADFDACAGLPELQRDGCYRSYALLRNDRKGCDAATDVSTKDDCYISLATRTNDARLCDAVRIGKPECYNYVAIQTNNYALCDKGKEPRQQCYKAFAAKDFSLCAEGMDRYRCYDAITDGNSANCALIEDSSSFCYYNIARETNNAELCGRITDESRSTCIFKVALATNNLALCESLTDTRDNCVAWIAFNTNNKELCYRAGMEAQSCIADIEGA